MLPIPLPPLNLEFLKAIKGAASLLKNPNNTESVFDIVDGMRHTEATKLAVDYLKAKPGVADLIAERYSPPTPDLKALLQLPTDSLGYIHASSLTAAGFDPEFYRKLDVQDDLTYVLLRMRQSHDIWHTVTGLSTDVTGELGLQAFSLAQTHLPLPTMLIAGGLLRTLLKSPMELEPLLDKLAIGYRAGMKAQPFLAQKWEDGWAKPLAEWRSQLNIEPVTVYVP